MTTIYYQNIDVFSGLAGTPLVVRNQEMISAGERHGQKESIQLQGALTGRCLDFSDWVNLTNTLKNRFSKDFQRLYIESEGQIVYDRPICYIRSIDFPSQSFAGLVPFTIDIENFPQDYFSGEYGILEPNNSYSYSEQPDGTVNLVRNISAKGINTNSSNNNALANARNFVYSFTGVTDEVLPLFITGMTGTSYCLKEISESINRFDGTYSVQETYSTDRSNAAGILRYVLDVNSGIQDGFVNVSLNGELNGCRGTSITGIRARYFSLPTYEIASTGAYNVLGVTGLNTGYLSSGVSENITSNKLTFDISFSNDPSPDVFMNYFTKINTEYLTDISTYDFSANFQAKGSLKQRFIKASGLYASTDIFTLIGSGYSGYDLGIPLNPKVLSSGLVMNRIAGEVSMDAQFNNEPVPPSGLDKFDYEISFVPSLNRYSTVLLTGLDNSSTDNAYVCYDLGSLTRAQLGIRGSAKISSETSFNDGFNVIKTGINTIKNTYLTGENPLKEGVNLSSGNKFQSKAISFDLQYSHQTSGFVL